jgi:hypothetical protein
LYADHLAQPWYDRLVDEHHECLPRRNQFTPGWDLVSAAAVVARTPAAPLP